MYRANRIEGRDGFVTFRRKPANWQAKEEEAKEAAQAAAPSSSGAATAVFLASLFVAVAGTIIGEHGATRCGIAAFPQCNHMPSALNTDTLQPRLSAAALGGLGSVQHYCNSGGVSWHGCTVHRCSLWQQRLLRGLQASLHAMP